MDVEEFNKLVSSRDKCKEYLFRNVLAVVIKLVIIVLMYYLYNMFVNHMTFWEATNWVGSAASSATDFNSVLTFAFAVLGLYLLSSIILDTILHPADTIVTTYTDGSKSYSHGYLRKMFCWILGIVVSVIVAVFIDEQVLKPFYPVQGDFLFAGVAIFWLLFFLVRDIFRITKGIVYTVQHNKIINRVKNDINYGSLNSSVEDISVQTSKSSTTDVTPIQPNLSANKKVSQDSNPESSEDKS